MRGIKTPAEIQKIKKACRLGDKIYSQILKKIKIGVTEKELSLEIQRLTRENGARLSFRPIISFGKNSFEIHHKSTEIKIKKNHRFVMMDLGTKVEGYCSDMTRTFFFGRASEKQKKIYRTVLKAQKRAIGAVKPNAKASDVDKVARDFILKNKFLSIPHSVGHGIGKRVHEFPKISPKSKTILKNGMVFTIEPGIYIKNFGGVRIEDTFALVNGKLIQLTKSPKSLIELV